MAVSNRKALHGLNISYQECHIICIHHWQEMSTSWPPRESTNSNLVHVPLDAVTQTGFSTAVWCLPISQYALFHLAWTQGLQLGKGISKNLRKNNHRDPGL